MFKITMITVTIFINDSRTPRKLVWWFDSGWKGSCCGVCCYFLLLLLQLHPSSLGSNRFNRLPHILCSTQRSKSAPLSIWYAHIFAHPEHWSFFNQPTAKNTSRLLFGSPSAWHLLHLCRLNLTNSLMQCGTVNLNTLESKRSMIEAFGFV